MNIMHRTQYDCTMKMAWLYGTDFHFGIFLYNEFVKIRFKNISLESFKHLKYSMLYSITRNHKYNEIVIYRNSELRILDKIHHVSCQLLLIIVNIVVLSFETAIFTAMVVLLLCIFLFSNKIFLAHNPPAQIGKQSFFFIQPVDSLNINRCIFVTPDGQ